MHILISQPQDLPWNMTRFAKCCFKICVYGFQVACPGFPRVEKYLEKEPCKSMKCQLM